MKLTLDRNLFTQTDLDSGALTMLGSIVHSLREPGEYRGVVHLGEQVKGAFSIGADKASPLAQATIDLAALTASAPGQDEDCCCCDGKPEEDRRRFSVNPRGYLLFHVSGGSGGYSVNLRRIDADEKDRGYDSRVLQEGDVFSASILRPGSYEMHNLVAEAKGRIRVSYPVIGEKAYRPPPPVRVACGRGSFEPAELELQPGQGILFEARTSSRIAIKLVEPDDGPGEPGQRGRAGYRRRPIVGR